MAYFYKMISANELRVGNWLLQKQGVKIAPVRCSLEHFEALLKGRAADFFSVVLKPEVLLKCGFIENKNYPLLPQAREFSLVLPVIGNGENEIKGYVKNNGECFARATLNGTPISNNIFQLHALQNLYFALAGKELALTL